MSKSADCIKLPVKMLIAMKSFQFEIFLFFSYALQKKKNKLKKIKHDDVAKLLFKITYFFHSHINNSIDVVNTQSMSVEYTLQYYTQ